MPSATSVSSRLYRLAHNAPYLWITSPRRAAAWLCGAGLALVITLAFEFSQPWRALASLASPESTSRAAYVSTELARITDDNVDTILFVGGSTTREFTASDRDLSALLARRCGRPIKFLNAGTSTQSLAESWTIVEAVPRHRRALVIVGMNYFRFEQGLDDVVADLPRLTLPFTPPASLRQSLAESGRPTGPALLQLRSTAWMLRQGYFSIRGNPDVRQAPRATRFDGPYNIYAPPALDAAHKADIARRMIIEELPPFRRWNDEAGDLWLAFAAHFSRHGTRPLFIFLPESASLKPLRDLVEPDVQRQIARLRAQGHVVVDWRRHAELDERDFYDQQHLLGSGRAKMEPRFIDLIAASIAGCGR